MSATRRILVAGLPAAAALFFAGSPALATVDHPARPAATATPCAEGARGGCGYGHEGGGTVTGAAVSTTAPAIASATGHTRGHGGVYGTTPPATHPTSPPVGTSPTAHVDTV